jgi:hypothetical protein
MSAPHQRPKEATAPAGPAAQSFADTFRRRPARAPHGLLPGRRVWVTLGWTAAVSATVTLSAALTASGVLDRDEEVTTASAGDSLPAGDTAVPAGSSSAPSPTPSPTPSKEKDGKKEKEKEKAADEDTGGEKGEEGAAVVRPAAPVTVTARPDTDDDGKKSADSAESGSGDSEKSTDTTSTAKRTQDFSRPVGRISGLYDPFIGRCIQLVGSSLQLYGCDGGGDQDWQFASDGTLRKGGRCLSLAGRSTQDGTPVVMASCDSTDVTQWRYSGGNDIVNVAADKCLDVANAATADGTPLQIAWCSGNSAQKWTAP